MTDASYDDGHPAGRPLTGSLGGMWIGSDRLTAMSPAEPFDIHLSPDEMRRVAELAADDPGEAKA